MTFPQSSTLPTRRSPIARRPTKDELTSGPVGPLRNTDYMVGLPTGMGRHTRFTEDGDQTEGCDAAGARRRPPRLRGVPPAFHRTAFALSSQVKCFEFTLLYHHANVVAHAVLSCCQIKATPVHARARRVAPTAVCASRTRRPCQCRACRWSPPPSACAR